MSTSRIGQDHLRDGLTRWGVLITIVLIVVLIGILLPINLCGSYRNRTCTNEQRQILMAMGVYANEHDRAWPVFTASVSGGCASVGDRAFDAAATAVASLELLTDCSGGNLTRRDMRCPANPLMRPSDDAADFRGPGPHHSAWVAKGPDQVGFRYDWSVPTDATSLRVVTADRDTTLHSGSIIAGFADGHVLPIRRENGIFPNRDAAGDDIYTAGGDGPMDVPGSGSTTRAFVR